MGSYNRFFLFVILREAARHRKSKFPIGGRGLSSWEIFELGATLSRAELRL